MVRILQLCSSFLRSFWLSISFAFSYKFLNQLDTLYQKSAIILLGLQVNLWRLDIFTTLKLAVHLQGTSLYLLICCITSLNNIYYYFPVDILHVFVKFINNNWTNWHYMILAILKMIQHINIFNLNQVMRTHQTNPDWAFYKTMSLYS